MSSPMTPARHSLLISTGAAILITGFFLATGMCTYESNDDMAMIRLLSGQQGIAATPDAVFMSLPLSSLLYLFYKFYPAAPWYGLVMYGALITGCAIGLRVIVEASTEIRNRIICTLAFLGFYMAIATSLNFASVSLFLWFCVCARIAQASLAERPHAAVDWLYGCLLGFSYLIRPDIIQTVAFLFSLPVIAALWLSPRKKRVVAVLVTIIITILVAAIWAQVVRNTPEYAAYKEFNKIRSSFTDTSLSDTSSHTPQALAATGWNISDHHLARKQWWLHDDSLFSAQKLDTFMKHNKGSEGSLLNFQTGVKNLRDQKIGLGIIILILAALLIGRHHPAPFRRTGQRIVSSALAITLINVLLLTMIRFPPRVALPVFVCLVLFAVVFRPFLGGVVWIRSGRVSWPLWSIFCAVVLTLVVSNYRQAARELLSFRKTKLYSDQSIQAVQRVAGKDVIFLNAGLNNAAFGAEFVNPLREYRDMVPFISLPSGWLISSPWYNAFLRANGLIDRGHLIPRLVDNPRIIMAYWDRSEEPFYKFYDIFKRHLQFHYGAQFPGATLTLNTVLDRRVSNKSGPAGWVFFTIHAVPSGSGHGPVP